jgi:hypothetical protein
MAEGLPNAGVELGGLLHVVLLCELVEGAPGGSRSASWYEVPQAVTADNA